MSTITHTINSVKEILIASVHFSLPQVHIIAYSNCFFCAQDNCRLTYPANGSLGWYAIALQVEDFISASSTVAMSSVPVQFLVRVQNITIPSGVTAPTFVGTTPADGSCIVVGSVYQQRVTARSGEDSAM